MIRFIQVFDQFLIELELVILKICVNQTINGLGNFLNLF